MGTMIAVVVGLGISLGMTYINARLLWDGHVQGRARQRDGLSYWGNPPPNPFVLTLGLVFALGWCAIWIMLPVALILRAFGIYI